MSKPEFQDICQGLEALDIGSLAVLFRTIDYISGRLSEGESFADVMERFHEMPEGSAAKILARAMS